MTKPIAVEVREGAGYIRYRTGQPVSTLDVLSSCSVAADIGDEGQVLGIEILDVGSAEQVDAARAFAKLRDLAFPRDLAGALSQA